MSSLPANICNSCGVGNNAWKQEKIMREVWKILPMINDHSIIIILNKTQK